MGNEIKYVDMSDIEDVVLSKHEFDLSGAEGKMKLDYFIGEFTGFGRFIYMHSGKPPVSVPFGYRMLDGVCHLFMTMDIESKKCRDRIADILKVNSFSLAGCPVIPPEETAEMLDQNEYECILRDGLYIRTEKPESDE